MRLLHLQLLLRERLLFFEQQSALFLNFSFPHPLHHQLLLVLLLLLLLLLKQLLLFLLMMLLVLLLLLLKLMG